MVKIKLFVKSILYRFNNPFLTYYLLPILTKNNQYVDNSYLNKDLLKTLKNLQGYQEFAVTSTGVLILFYRNEVIKIPLGEVSKESLDKNWENYNLLKKSEFNEFTNYELTKTDNYYKMEKLKNTTIEDENINEILNKFSLVNKIVKLDKFKNSLFVNLSKIESICNMTICFPGEIDVKSVVMHGDLTKNNIMKNSQQNIVLIDLDRFTFQGIEDIDKIHYMVDRESKKMGISFFEYLETKINNCNSKKELKSFYIYLLLRICYEHNDLIKLNIKYYQDIKRVIKKFNFCNQELY